MLPLPTEATIAKNNNNKKRRLFRTDVAKSSYVRWAVTGLLLFVFEDFFFFFFLPFFPFLSVAVVLNPDRACSRFTIAR